MATANVNRVRYNTVLLITVLGALTAVAPLAIDMYVPGLPQMSVDLGAGPAGTQLSMTALLVGMAIGQLVIGPVSDGVGRRSLILVGSVGFVIFSVGCALAPNLEVLLVARVLQGFAGAAGMVLARAVVLDLFIGPQVPRYMAVLSQILSVAPVIAPVLGGAVLAVAPWRAIFALLAVIGVLLTYAVFIGVPESLPSRNRHPRGAASVVGVMVGLLRNRPFVGYALVLGFGCASMFAYISGSSFVFQEMHGLSAGAYSLVFASNAVGALAGGFAYGALSRTIRLNTLLLASVSVALVGTVMGVVSTLTWGESLAGTWSALFVVMVGTGALIPATFTLGQAVGHHAAGTASALLGGAQVAFGAIAAPLVGAFGVDSSLPMATVMLVAMLMALATTLLVVQPHRGYGEAVLT
ncbi:multidrug effflux MFS transporter [Alloalcanivorax gelatiniphagus]